MKNPKLSFNLVVHGLFAMAIVCSGGCSVNHWIKSSGSETDSQASSVSKLYNDFEGGVLFHDVHEGLDVLWQAGFKKSQPFKEHLAFFITEGVLICPNAKNTLYSASLIALPVSVERNKFLVYFDGEYRAVLGIIHTHVVGLSKPTPRNDFQFSYLGIHNYVMSKHQLYDAYKDSRDREVIKRLGDRTAYEKLPFYDRQIVSRIEK